MTQQDTQPPAETLAIIEMLQAAEVQEGVTVFDHSAEEIGIAVMENHRAILATLTRRAGGDAILNSWARSAEDTRAMALLLAEVELHLKSSRIFITTREKMHPCGVDLHDELAVKVTAALDNLGREDGDARR